MKIDDILQSKILKWTIFGVLIFTITVFVFSVGVFVGTRSANFAFDWADQYHRNFGGPEGGIFGDFSTGGGLTSPNGCFGQIIKIDLDKNVITVKDRDVEKVILVGDKTTIVFQKDNLKISDLKVDDKIVVIGEPNEQGQIEARLIRVMPSIKTSSSSGMRINIQLEN